MTPFLIQSAFFVAALVYLVRYFTARFERAEHLWTQERSLLLTRIQHPERVVMPTADGWKHRPPVRDELDRVGRIDFDPMDSE